MSPHNIRGIRALVEAMPGMTVDKVSHLLYDASGLLGVSGISAYMEVLLSSADARAAEAVRHFVCGCMRTIGSLAAPLGGLDAIVFTAGIGEHSVEVRRWILEGCSWLGIHVDEEANRAHGPRISTAGSVISCWVIPTDEEIVVARQTRALLGL